jgi:hypothetical protein
MARDVVPVAEAAELLGVNRQRVHQLLRSGALRGDRLGHSWFVSLDSIHARRALAPGRGRPLSAARAWALLDRIERRAAPVPPLNVLAAAVRRRADRRPVRVLPGLLARARDDSLAVAGGVIAAAAAGAPVNDQQPPFDLYLVDADVDGFERRMRPSSSGAPNIILHVVPSAIWPFEENQRVTGQAVAAVDLAEAGDRAASEAFALLSRSSP